MEIRCKYRSESERFTALFDEYGVIKAFKLILNSVGPVSWLWKPHLHNQRFRARTKEKFYVEYELELAIKRVETGEFIKADMDLEKSHQILADDFNRYVFLPFLREHSYMFHLDSKGGDPLATIVENCETEDKSRCRGVDEQRLKSELQSLSYIKNGCLMTIRRFSVYVPHELVEENYWTLSESDRDEIEKNENYVAFDEKLTVAALKRQLEFLRSQQKQRYNFGEIGIETERAGKALKIRWKFKNRICRGYELVGFRRTQGFYPNQYDLDNNGTRVVQSRVDGEVTEVLEHDTAYFYTFLYEPVSARKNKPVIAVVRFQVTASMDEVETIRAAIRRIEARKAPDPEKETLSRALNELGEFVEMDTAFEAMERSFMEQIEKSNHSEETKKLKIERLQDIVQTIRSKYEP
jgi:hypothetical protein